MDDRMIPEPCDSEIFEKGQPIAALDGRSQAVERWVKMVAEQASARIDWHYSGGVAQVLHIGDADSRNRVMATMRELAVQLDGHILRIFNEGEQGLYRKGVTPTRPGAIGAFYEGGSASTYIMTDEDAHHAETGE